jgi:L-iditol 2-dehydrogenase
MSDQKTSLEGIFMQAAVFMGKHDLQIKDVPQRQPDPDEIMIRVAACGVCGTDHHIFSGDKGSADCPSGTVLGHEFSGTVAAVGSHVTRFRIGDRVSVDPNDYCGTCDFCRNGKAHFCENMIGIGTTAHGGFAEYCTFNASKAYHLPDSLPFEQGAMAEPVGCCLHGIDLCHIKTGDTVLILGGGTIGLLMLQLALAAGAAQAIVIEPVKEKRKVARSLGASLCIDPSSGDTASALLQSGIRHIDVCIECVGLGSTVLEAIRLVGRGGTVMMFGLTPPDCEIAIHPFDIFQREIHLTASFINPYTLHRALDLIHHGRVRIEPLLGPRLPLTDLPLVLADPKYRKLGKILIVP